LRAGKFLLNELSDGVWPRARRQTGRFRKFLGCHYGVNGTPGKKHCHGIEADRTYFQSLEWNLLLAGCIHRALSILAPAASPGIAEMKNAADG
jgi:hypothetical protein